MNNPEEGTIARSLKSRVEMGSREGLAKVNHLLIIYQYKTYTLKATDNFILACVYVCVQACVHMYRQDCLAKGAGYTSSVQVLAPQHSGPIFVC